MPGCCIGVDVIVGFPGETEEEFLKTYQFINELDVSYLHVFTYSERPNTAAIDMDSPVEIEVRKQRSKMLRSLSLKKRRHFYNQHIGREMNVLFEQDIEAGKIHGFTDNYIRVAVPHEKGLVNQLLGVKLQKIDPNGIMQGQLVRREVAVE